MKLPLCREVCKDCEDGQHDFHVITEFGDLWATRTFQSLGWGWHYHITGKVEDAEELMVILKAAVFAIEEENE